MVEKFGYLAVLISFLTSCSAPPGAWEEMVLRDDDERLYLSSSELENRGPYVRGPYGARNLFDGNIKTCWSEGAKSDGIGESICVALEKETKNIILQNGYAKNTEVFIANNRVKEAELSILAGINIPGEVTETGVLFNTLQYKKTKTIILEDSPEPQTIAFPFKWRSLVKFRTAAIRSFRKLHRKKLTGIKQSPQAVLILQLKILSIYKGTKYDDTCITSISFQNKTGPDSKKHKTQVKIYVNKSQNAILINTGSGEPQTLVRDPKSIFQIVDVSKDSNWLIAIHMPANISHTRVETDYHLYNVALREKIPSSFISEGAGELYGFKGVNENTILMYADNKKMKDEKILLSKIYDKLK
ncbi:MAG: hypothetical protein U9O97_04690 [Elusimicrobiota bacterium]|nr:hypothetical protein [Elusimicrobiota bacterium]